MITGSLQQKNGYYYAVLYIKVDGKRKCKWIPTKLPVNGTSNRKAQKAFDDIRIEYEREQEEIQRKEAELAELTKNTHPDALLHSPTISKSGSTAHELLWPPRPTRATPT